MGAVPWQIWRTRVQPIRTASELDVRIMISVNKQAILYKTFAVKAKQLHMLGISYETIGRSLNIGQETARKACHYDA
jgi:hypothetical protein